MSPQPLRLQEPAPREPEPQPFHGELQTDLLQALAEFVEAYEDSGYHSVILGAAYLHAKRVLRRVNA